MYASYLQIAALLWLWQECDTLVLSLSKEFVFHKACEVVGAEIAFVCSINDYRKRGTTQLWSTAELLIKEPALKSWWSLTLTWGCSADLLLMEVVYKCDWLIRHWIVACLRGFFKDCSETSCLQMLICVIDWMWGWDNWLG